MIYDYFVGLSKSDAVDVGDNALIEKLESDLRDTTRAFNNRHGWGRAISAVQIGIPRKVIFLNEPIQRLIINPEVVNASDEMVEIWDDCMSFPELLVKVKRYKSFTLKFLDRNWRPQEQLIEGELAELIQHEMDHLNGIVATMRAIDGSQFALQSQKMFLAQELLANKRD